MPSESRVRPGPLPSCMQVPAHVISRPGSPVAWDFADKATGVLKEDPPRPGSATLLSPPLQRKVPVSVDSHLRKLSARAN